MFAIKHDGVAAELKRRIESGVYVDRLPPMRLLRHEFAISLQTMHKAIRTLAASGCIIPSSRGTLIRRNPQSAKPKTGVVAVVSALPLKGPDADHDTLIQAILGGVNQFGRKGVFLIAPPDLYDHQPFWDGGQFDGYVFIYSAFYRYFNHDLKRNLDRRGIPFVVANSLPDAVDAHWVNFDLSAILRFYVDRLVERGLRRIALFANIPEIFPAVDPYVRAWNGIMGSLGLRSYNTTEADFCDPERAIERWLDDSEPPEAVISLNIDASAMIERFHARGLPVTVIPVVRPQANDQRLGLAAAAMLADLLDGKADTPKYRIVPWDPPEGGCSIVSHRAA